MCRTLFLSRSLELRRVDLPYYVDLYRYTMVHVHVHAHAYALVLHVHVINTVVAVSTGTCYVPVNQLYVDNVDYRYMYARARQWKSA